MDTVAENRVKRIQWLELKAEELATDLVMMNSDLAKVLVITDGDRNKLFDLGLGARGKQVIREYLRSVLVEVGLERDLLTIEETQWQHQQKTQKS